MTWIEDKHQHRRTWLYNYILDSCNFQDCFKSLANNKSLGPAGIVNELFNAIPTEYQKSYFSLDYKGLQPGMAAQTIGPNKKAIN